MRIKQQTKKNEWEMYSRKLDRILAYGTRRQRKIISFYINYLFERVSNEIRSKTRPS
jgi:hypothetical protein